MTTRDRPTVRETTAELRLVVLALVVLAIGAAAVCSLERSTVTRIRNPNQPAPLEATGRSLSVQGPEKPAGWVRGGAAVGSHPSRPRGHCSPCASESNSEPGESRFLRLRRPPWDRRYVVNG